jgi:cobalt/nickel transport system permease protein
MRHNFLDRYSRLDSPIHRLPPAAKLVAALAVVIVTALLPRSGVIPLAAVFALLMAVAVISHIPGPFLLRRVLLLEPFVLAVAGLALVQADGFRLFLFLLGRCTVCLLAMVLLANTTPFSDLVKVLKAARVPALLVTTMSLMYRYLFVLLDEAGRMKRARASRTFSRRRARAWQSAATVASQLFIRSSERADRIWAAMCARGWR